MKTWTLESAIAFCKLLEPFAAQCGTHCALTGGCCYKEGERSDLDIAFYPHGGTATIDRARLFEALYALGVQRLAGTGWRYVGYLGGKQKIDFLFV